MNYTISEDRDGRTVAFCMGFKPPFTPTGCFYPTPTRKRSSTPNQDGPYPFIIHNKKEWDNFINEWEY